MGGRSGRATVTAAATVVVCLSLLLTGCGDSGDTGLADEVIPLPTEAPTNSTTSTSTTTTVADFGFDHDLVQHVWHDYEAAVGAIDAASSTPNPDDPGLVEHLSGPMLEHWRTKLAEQRSAGQRVAFPPGSKHREELMGIRSLSAELAELDVCSLDDAVVTGPNGEIVNDDISLSRIVETMRLEDGRWKWTERNGSRVTTEQCPGF